MGVNDSGFMRKPLFENICIKHIDTFAFFVLAAINFIQLSQ
jgi:hypothetical protein